MGFHSLYKNKELKIKGRRVPESSKFSLGDTCEELHNKTFTGIREPQAKVWCHWLVSGTVRPVLEICGTLVFCVCVGVCVCKGV